MKPFPEVVLETGTLVIADLHLDVERPEDVEGFCSWLAGLGDTPALLVLGDLFEYWIGRDQAQRPGARRILEALRQLSDRGTKLEFLHGNRDFLLDAEFEALCGGRVHPAGLTGLLSSGDRVLFLHGDELMTRDYGYRALRACLRSRLGLFLARNLPDRTVDALAQRIRAKSRAVVPRKAPLRIELDPAASVRAATRAGARTLVCGHVHRHRDETLEGGVRLLVLDAFGAGPDDAVRIESNGELSAVSAAGSGDYPPRER